MLAISVEVFGLDSLRAVSSFFLFPLLGVVAILMVFKPADIDRAALIGFAWGVLACAAYDLFRLPGVYVFHLRGDFFGRIGGWATGMHSNYLAGYLWRYFGDGAGIGVVVFIHAAVIGVASVTGCRYRCRGHLTVRLPQGWRRPEHEWLNPFQAACGPPATPHDLPRPGHRALAAHKPVLGLSDRSRSRQGRPGERRLRAFVCVRPRRVKMAFCCLAVPASR